VIRIGIVCGPKVFIESCVGFYDDPTREWERQWRAWKDFIDYTLLCVKNADLWAAVPEGLRAAVDGFLQEGFKVQQHSGGWWAVKDAKKKLLRTRRGHKSMPDPRKLAYASHDLLYAAKRNDLVPQGRRVRCRTQHAPCVQKVETEDVEWPWPQAEQELPL
jgi:hypothetical protein